MIRAAVDQKFFLKFLLVFFGCLAFSGWCLYDGLVAAPKKLTMALAYESLPDDDNRRDAWRELAQSQGWPTITPQKSSKEVRNFIGSQFLMIFLCAMIGIPALLKWMSGQGTWVEGDESVIRNSKGVEVPVESITKIDKRKWRDKGIAKIHYETNGKAKKFVMDDFKYHRESMGELMKFAEANLTAEQVDGDDLEREKVAKSEETTPAETSSETA